MVRVWFGDESQGLRRDRKEFVLTIQRPCRDMDAAKRFYCEGLGFSVSGVTSGHGERRVYIVHKLLPSIAISLVGPMSGELPPLPDTGVLLDIGMWDEPDWHACFERMADLGHKPVSEKLANPHQKWIDYRDPDGFVIRLTYTRPPVNTGKRDERSD